MKNSDRKSANQVSQAIAFYDRLLETGHLGSTYDAVASARDSKTDPANPRQFCNVLRPRLLSTEQAGLISAATTATFSALKKLQSKIAKSPELLSELGLCDQHVSLVRNTLAPTVGVLGRFDGFLDTTGQVQFTEFNPFSGALVYLDTVAAAFLEAPILRAFREKYPFKCTFTVPHILPAVGKSYAKHGGHGVPRIGIISNAGADPAAGAPSAGSVVSLRYEHSFEVQQIIRLLHQHGVPHSIGTPAELDYSPSSGLTIHGQKVDAAFVGSWEDFVGEPASHPLFVAARDRAVWLLNSVVDTVMLGNKATFALLSDPATNGFLSDVEREAVATHVPWTRIWRPGKVEFEGREEDLFHLVSRNKDEFVLKPADSFGGATVHIGKDCTTSEWEGALEGVSSARFVVQRLIRSDTDSYPVMEDGQLTYVDHHQDVMPYIWSDETAHGIGCRASRSSVTNLKLGASLLPTFVLED